jgi:hypothetical protein
VPCSCVARHSCVSHGVRCYWAADDLMLILSGLAQRPTVGRPIAMTERITHSTVHFAHPFALPDVEGEHPPGAYAVETTEVPIGGLSFIAYRRVSTTINLASNEFGPGSRQIVTIDPLDLEAAQKRDAARTALPE